jgi:hypothetical protein
VEEWRAIPGYDGYEASSEARIRNAITGHVIAQHDNGWGYMQSGVRRTGAKRIVRTAVHRLVALAFVPNPLGLRTVNHDDLDKKNNRPENLTWMSQKQNQEHASAAKLYCPAHNPKRRHKYSPETVLALRNMYATGKYTFVDLAQCFGMSVCQARKIALGLQWKHLINAVEQADAA